MGNLTEEVEIGLVAKFHRWMLEAFALRIDADYAAGSFAEAWTVEEMLERAAEFADAARDYLET